MIKRNIRHGFEGSGLTDDEIDSYDISGPVGMVSAIALLGGEWPLRSRDAAGLEPAREISSTSEDAEWFRARWGCD